MKRIIALGAVVLVVVLVWTGGWFFIAGEIRKNIELQASADGVASPRITCGELGISGFPFRFDIACKTAEVLSGDVNAQLAELRSSVLVYQPTFFRFWAQGPLKLEDAFTGSKSEVTWTGLEMSARFKGWQIDRISLIGDNLAWNDTLFGQNLIASASHMEAHVLDMPEQHQPDKGLGALAVYTTTQGLVSPGMQVANGESSLEAEITGVPADVRGFAEPAAIAQFRDAPGQLKIVSLKSTDGDSYVDANGTLALDSAARLEGQFELKSKGLVERLEPMFDPNIKPLITGSPQPDGSYQNTLFVRGGVIVSGVIPLGVVPALLPAP